MKNILILLAMSSILIGCAKPAEEPVKDAQGHSEGDGHDHGKTGEAKEKGTQGRLRLAPGVVAHYQVSSLSVEVLQ